MLSINISELIWTVINFFLLFFLLRHFLYKPICEHMDARQARIDAGLEKEREARRLCRRRTPGWRRRSRPPGRRPRPAAARAEEESLRESARPPGRQRGVREQEGQQAGADAGSRSGRRMSAWRRRSLPWRRCLRGDCCRRRVTDNERLEHPLRAHQLRHSGRRPVPGGQKDRSGHLPESTGTR